MALLLFTGLTIISLLNILVHCAGLKLLLCLYRDQEKVQTLLLIHLSATEIFGNVCWIIIDGLQVVELSLPTACSEIIETIQEYVSTVTSSAFLYVYYMVMVYIMVEKFLDIHLDLKYDVYCRTNRVNNLMAVTWFAGWMFCISLILVSKVGGVDYYMSMVKYIYPVFDVSVLLVIVLCYGYVFNRYRQWKTETDFNKRRRRESTLSMIVRSHFRVTLLLVLTFVGLVMVPDMMYFSKVIQDGVVTAPSAPLLITYHVSFFSDAVIYIFMNPDSLRFLKKNLLSCLYGTSCERGTVIQGLKKNVKGYTNDLREIPARLVASPDKPLYDLEAAISMIVGESVPRFV